MKSYSILCLCGLLIQFAPLRAQFIEDALRLATPQGFHSARAGSIGLAFAGIADDLAALNSNPAGLSLVPVNEFAFGLQHNNSENTGLFLNNSFALDGTSTALNSLGFVTPFESDDADGAFGISYTRETDFANDYEAAGFNSSSSIVTSWIADHSGNSSPDLNLAYRLFLADTVDGAMISPINGNVQQEIIVEESGGIHNISGGIAMDLAPNLSFGASLSGKWGSYSYLRLYRENDSDDRYQSLDTLEFTDVDFRSLEVREAIEQDISGINMTLGLQARIDDHLRVGVTVRTPSIYQIEEEFVQTAVARFDNDDAFEDVSDGFNSYEVSTPWVFGLSASGSLMGLTLSAGIEYQALGELEFDEALAEVLQLNSEIKRALAEQLSWGIGAEYDVPDLPLAFRAGYTHIGATYKSSALGDERSVLSFGAGFYFSDQLRLDAMLRTSSLSEQRANYFGSESVATIERSLSDIALQFVYRFD